MSVMKVGLLGGSFDPIHKGHLELAKAILKDGCQEIWFLPCLSSPLKERSLSKYEDRLKMIQLAIKPYKKMKICEIEKELPSPSYTINTLKELTRRYNYEFLFYIGFDQANQLHLWKDIEECMKLAEFRIFERGDEKLACHYSLKQVKFKPMDISSTQIRKGSFGDVSKPVLNYIWDKRLYLEEYAASQMDEKRYAHSVSVAKVCQELALANHLNDKDAYVIGLLHDICKRWSYEKSKAWMECYEKDHINEPVAIWHGYLVDHYLKHVFKIKEKYILEAVHHHVLGDSSNPYAQIVYIADKCEPLRGYDASYELALAKKNLNEAVEYVKESQKAYLKKEKKIHE
ncbi:MAG: nicotinate (nicotinamide) nucleotide adenylyltransferase [Traorella sp.]